MWRDIINFARTSRYSRLVAYDNLLWKILSFKTWCNPCFMLTDLNSINASLRLWYNWKTGKRLTNKDVLQIFLANIWRVIYIALQALDAVPSITFGRAFFSRKSECFPTNRTLQYTSLLGHYMLKRCTPSWQGKLCSFQLYHQALASKRIFQNNTAAYF